MTHIVQLQKCQWQNARVPLSLARYVIKTFSGQMMTAIQEVVSRSRPVSVVNERFEWI
jgi:hypothetical protein